MALSTYAGNMLLNAMFRNASAQVAAAYASLHSADPGLTGASELAAAGGYGVRPSMAFDAAAAGATANSAEVLTPEASADWLEATHQGLWDASGAGNFLWPGALTDARTILDEEKGRWAAAAVTASISTAFSETTRNAMLDCLLRNTALAYAASWMSLHSGDPGTDGSNELAAANGYARVQLTFGDAAANKAISITAQVDTPQASADWAQATYVGIWTLDAAGTFVWGKALTTARTVRAGKRLRVAVGGITVSIDP